MRRLVYVAECDSFHIPLSSLFLYLSCSKSNFETETRCAVS